MARKRVVLEVAMEEEYLADGDTINGFFREVIKQLEDRYPEAIISVLKGTQDI